MLKLITSTPLEEVNGPKLTEHVPEIRFFHNNTQYSICDRIDGTISIHCTESLQIRLQTSNVVTLKGEE